MKTYWLTAAAIAVFGLVGGWLVFGGNRAADDSAMSVDVAAAARGADLYAANCAACHGANLEGQPEWQSPGADGRLPAPPHDASGHTWHHGDDLLFNYTKLGGKAALAAKGIPFVSGMPGFAEVLSDDDIRDILTFMKSTWPERERELQATRTEAERLQKEANK